MPVRVVKSKAALAPRLQLDRMDQLHMRCDAREGCVYIVMLEVQEHVFPPIRFARRQVLPPDRPLERASFVDGKAALEKHEVTEVLPDRQTKYCLVKDPRSVDVADEGDRIDEAAATPGRG